MKVGIVKPDWGIRGGFEVVVERVEQDLVTAGHQVERVEVPVAGLAPAPFGASVPDRAWGQAAEWFTHMALLETFRGLDVRRFDVVISTQPPSYGVRHPRQLALFYHHLRAFYDLEQVWVAAGRASAALHHAAAALLRANEAEDIAGVRHFLAGSTRVQERLRNYHGDVPVSLYEAPAPQVEIRSGRAEHVLTVSRHEFTKRTELALAAFALGTVPGVIAGAGGRLPFVRDLAGRIATGAVDAAALAPEQTWLNLGQAPDQPCEAVLDHVRVPGRVSADELDRLYRDALCVVAPAYDEDDGLTVREAMAYGRPVVVCRDGGGLVSFVEDGVNGLVVDPEPAAIAAAVRRLADDAALASSLGAAGRATAERLTPKNAADQLLDALELVAGTAR